MHRNTHTSKAGNNDCLYNIQVCMYCDRYHRIHTFIIVHTLTHVYLYVCRCRMQLMQQCDQSSDTAANLLAQCNGCWHNSVCINQNEYVKSGVILYTFNSLSLSFSGAPCAAPNSLLRSLSLFLTLSLRVFVYSMFVSVCQSICAENLFVTIKENTIQTHTKQSHKYILQLYSHIVANEQHLLQLLLPLLVPAFAATWHPHETLATHSFTH